MPQSPRSDPARDVLAAEEFELPARDPRLHVEPAHDVLAAEEFEFPGPDPALHVEPAHDVLAAEEFEFPGPDPSLHHGPFTPPEDRSGLAVPHDVLAADEFAVPAGRRPIVGGATVSNGRPRALLLAGAVAFVTLARRRRHS